MSSVLEQVQEDCQGRLLADAYFANVSILLQRKAVVAKVLIEHLAVLNTRNGKSGACVMVLMPRLQVPDPEIPGPRTAIMQSFLVIENPSINALSTGTGLSAEKLAVAALQLFHLFIPYGVTQCFTAADGAIVPNFEFEGHVAYVVTVRTFVALAKPAKVQTPAIAVAAAVGPATGSDITLTCGTGSAAILYSIDGSYPTLPYTAPVNVAVPAGVTVRTAATLSGSQQSDVAQQLLT